MPLYDVNSLSRAVHLTFSAHGAVCKRIGIWLFCDGQRGRGDDAAKAAGHALLVISPLESPKVPRPQMYATCRSDQLEAKGEVN